MRLNEVSSGIKNTVLSVKLYHDEHILKSKQGGETVDQKKIDKLYELLEQAEEELDDEAVAALRWAILRLEE